MAVFGCVGRARAILWAAAILLSLPTAGRAASWAPDHIVVVVLENKSFSQVIGDPAMPYLNSLAKDGALMTQSYFGQIPYGRIHSGFTSALPARPSQPNYL